MGCNSCFNALALHAHSVPPSLAFQANGWRRTEANHQTKICLSFPEALEKRKKKLKEMTVRTGNRTYDNLVRAPISSQTLSVPRAGMYRASKPKCKCNNFVFMLISPLKIITFKPKLSQFFLVYLVTLVTFPSSRNLSPDWFNRTKEA